MIGFRLSRREFLVATGAAAAVIATPQLLRAPLRAESIGELLRADRFAPLIGRNFLFRTPSHADVRLVLRAVEGVGGAKVAERRFSLRFDGAAAQRQGGRTGELLGPDLPPMTLLAVPSGPVRSDRQEWVITVVADHAAHDPRGVADG